VNSAPCKILFDNGAEISYLSNRLAKHPHVETKEANQHATFADGTSTPLHQTIVPVNLKIEGYTEATYLAVCPLSSYDVILGKQWLSKYDPMISHKTNEITFQFQNQNVTIHADLERHKSLVSASTFSRVIRRGYKTFALLLKPRYHRRLRLLKSNLFWTNLLMFSQTTCPKVCHRVDPMTSKLNYNPMHCPSKKGFNAYQPNKLRNLRNNYMIFWIKALSSPVQVLGGPRSCLSIRKMEGSVFASITEPSTR
jgi:hypothetical protein